MQRNSDSFYLLGLFGLRLSLYAGRAVSTKLTTRQRYSMLSGQRWLAMSGSRCDPGSMKIPGTNLVVR